jgi:superfamily II DNA/RNA helicase
MYQKNQQTTEMGRSFLDLLGYYHRASKMLSKSDAKAAPKMGITSSKTVGFTTAGSKKHPAAQVADVRNAGHLVAATPGRLLDVMDSSTLLTPTLSLSR